jgi:serine/threonine protein phosphatase PrpC
MSEKNEADTVEIPASVSSQARSPASISSLVGVEPGAASHKGMVRPNNEDHYLVARFDRAMQLLMTNLPPGQVPHRSAETAYGMVVADGLGGAAAGEVASRTAITALVDLVLRTPDWIMRPDGDLIEEVKERMDRRFRQISQELVEQARADPGLTGMGTTMTLACSLGADMVVAHVGDSRAYILRQGRLVRLTRDHTLAQALADSGAIERDDEAAHRMRHVLTNVIGAKADSVKAELHRVRLADGDQVLLCTDGLTEMATDAAVADVLRKGGSAAEACDALIDLALAGGGRDNVTAVLARYRIPEGGE